MDGMRIAPVFVRRERKETDYPPNHVVRPARSEKRVMATVMLDHEQPYDQAGRRHRKQQRDPIPIFEGQGDCDPKRNQRSCGGEQLKHATRGAWPREGSKAFSPSVGNGAAARRAEDSRNGSNSELNKGPIVIRSRYRIESYRRAYKKRRRISSISL